MPPLPGEELVLTVFADIHYFVNEPGSDPQHDRFSRGSYVYLYYNGIQRKARLEVANHAGTPKQDAFNGYLDTIIITNSHKQQNLVSVTISGIPAKPASPRTHDPNLWSLPVFDLRREQKYLYKLHTVDLYFWRAEDAIRFTDACQQYLTPQQLNLQPGHVQQSVRLPQAEHATAHHPVVQQLEKVAIDNPVLGTAGSNTMGQSNLSAVYQHETHGSSKDSQARSLPSPPAAYNPAAPAAPEPIAHREKTPPPPELATPGLPLSTPSFFPGPPSSGHSHLPPPPAGGPSGAGVPSSLPGPPPRPSLPTFDGPPQSSSPVSAADHSSNTAYATYSYEQSAALAQSHASTLHSTFYTPTAAEVAHGRGHHGHHAGVSQALGHTALDTGSGVYDASNSGTGSQTGKADEGTAGTGSGPGGRLQLDQRIGKVEKGVNRWLRKLDQRI